MKYDVVIKKVPSFNVVSLRTTIPSYNSEGELWGKFMSQIYKNNITIQGMCYALFFEDGYKENEVDIEIGHEVKKLIDNVDDLVFKKLDEIPVAATMLVTGDYEPNIAIYCKTQTGLNSYHIWPT